MLLEVEDIDVTYGESLVCEGVTITVDPQEVVCLLGRNGVGKTTLMRALMGILPNRRGRIRFDGQDISRRSSFARAHLGLAYVPQGRMVFPELTVAENLRAGTLIGGKGKFSAANDIVFEYFPILRERLGQNAGTLSGGEQQMLAIGRALAGNPRLLLLDEPSEGIQPSIVQEIREIIKRVAAEQHLAVFLVEQNLKFAMLASSRGYVMDKGRIVTQGSPEALSQDSVVCEHLTFAAADRDGDGDRDGGGGAAGA
ncbi:ABC transporter ATP-binding protein [Pelagibius sp. CAU 1746]|uniref:ABC transporter ATP-binding protein n=1 Tax=Pelagibius sp. CAU 1746 TaxID=3140370 RepID=UPI00325B3BC5